MSKQSCLSFIRRHISRLKEGQIFTTRDCLIYGKRSNVDNALFRCVRGGVIIRIARGVFVRRTSNFTPPSPLEIAIIKARSFGKELLTHGADTCAKYKLIPSGNDQPTYYVDGCTSRFFYQGNYINFRRASKKRMRLLDDRAGLAIRALWHIGKKTIQQIHIDKLDRLWNIRVEKEKIFTGKAWMPSWLGDRFLTTQYVGPYGPGTTGNIGITGTAMTR